MLLHRILVSLPVVFGLPASHPLREIAESNKFDDFENYLPKYDDLPSFDVISNNLEDEKFLLETTEEKTNGKNVTQDSGGNMKSETPNTTVLNEMTTYLTESPDLDMATIIPENVNQTETNDNYEVFMMFNKNLTSRYPRQELNETEDDPEFRNKDNQSQEDDSEEGNGNMLTGLLSAFLGTLSKPDGSIDIEAIVGLLGSLSTQNPDGTYDFQGLTDLLQGFFGGGGGEGGSDVGAFVGGLLGAVIKGLANPPGPKGAGVLTGKIVSGILPALSVPDKTDDDDMPDDKKPPTEEVLDSGSFLSGILKTIFGASSGQGGGMINIVQSVKTSIKSLFTSSSKSPMSMG